MKNSRFHMLIFRRGFHGPNGERTKILKFLETAIKCTLLLLLPVPFAIGATLFWYFLLFKQAIHFGESMELIITSAWIPTFGILYTLMAAIVLSTVWAEYKSMRTAVKRYDFQTFADLRDEEMSPLVHVLLVVLSTAVLGAFMGLKYPSPMSGACLISTTAYVLALIFFVIIEIDDPCGGIWFIKNIHKEWLEMDVKKWRARKAQEKREEFLKHHQSLQRPEEVSKP